MKVYGKEPEQMKDVNAMFQLVLADYTLGQVKEAFKFYLKHYSDLPAPADIANIIDRGNKPPFEKALYVSICKKDMEFRTHDEDQYRRDYERFILRGDK